jgi:hypothetical protein
MAGVISTTLGILLVAAALRDVIHELFDPEDTGSLSRAVMHGVWRAVRAVGLRRPKAIYHAGALVLLSVAIMWTGLLTLGFALVYWVRLPTGFHVNAALPPPAGQGFGTAIYVSLTALTSIGSSDIVPLADGMRYAGALESLLGVALITAWITWVLSIYPVLARRRAFARETDLVRRVHPDPGTLVNDTPGDVAAELLRSLTEQVLRITSDLAQARVTYYFQNRSQELALGVQLPYLLALARTAEGEGRAPAVRQHGALLRTALETLLGELGDQFLSLRDAPADRVLEALARDHLLQRVGKTG